MKRGKLFIECILKGEKLNYLIGYLENKKIAVYKLLELDGNRCKVTLDYVDRHKFFAISKNMCYNITNIKYRGVYAPLVLAYKNIGVVIGALLFAIVIALSSDYILRIETVGSGSYFSSEILFISKQYGLDKYKRFSEADVVSLKQALLSQNPELSFVSIQKNGNVVTINSAKQKDGSEILGKNQTDLVCDVNGVVESISVLRGTPLVSVGDCVCKGVPLIGAYITGREDKIFPTYIVGRVTVLEEKVKIFKLERVDENAVKTAEAIAKFAENDEVVYIESQIKDGGVEIKLKIRHVITGG